MAPIRDIAKRQKLKDLLKVLQSLARVLRKCTEGRLLTRKDMDRVVGANDALAEIEAAMDRARVAVLLISADSLSSEFILDTEVPRLLERRRSEGLRVIPLMKPAGVNPEQESMVTRCLLSPVYR